MFEVGLLGIRTADLCYYTVIQFKAISLLGKWSRLVSTPHISTSKQASLTEPSAVMQGERASEHMQPCIETPPPSKGAALISASL